VQSVDRLKIAKRLSQQRPANCRRFKFAFSPTLTLARPSQA